MVIAVGSTRGSSTGVGSHVGASHDGAALGHVQKLRRTLADATDGELVQERAGDGIHLQLLIWRQQTAGNKIYCFAFFAFSWPK